MTSSPNTRMQCDEVARAIPWLLDEELDSQQTAEVEAHLHGCPDCRVELQREGQLRLAVRRAGELEECPDSLRSKIGSTCARERRRHLAWQRTWPAVSAAAILASFIWQGTTGNAEAQDLEEAAVRHARNLPMDVVAGDLGRVEQYFDGKLPFAVHVPDVMRNQPASIQLGGRVIDLSNREAAYVRYDLPGGRMSVFVYPDPNPRFSEVIPGYQIGDRRVLIRQVRGYTTAQWHAQGLVYSVVTDLPERELSTVLTANIR